MTKTNELEKILQIASKIENNYIHSKYAIDKPLMVFGKYGLDVVDIIRSKNQYWPVKYNSSPNDFEIKNSVFFKTCDYL